MAQPRMRVSAVVLGAPDPRALAAFYERLLGWTVVDDAPVWVRLRSPSGGAGLSFQHEASFVPPVWPDGNVEMRRHLLLGTGAGVRLPPEEANEVLRRAWSAIAPDSGAFRRRARRRPPAEGRRAGDERTPRHKSLLLW